MPTYEYLCSTCRHRFDIWQKMSDDALTTCPECGASIHRVLHATGIVFKGSGFYKNDYSNNGNASANAASNGSNGSGESKKTESESKTTASSESTASTTSAGESKAPASTTSSSK